jgi:hypothetical protein
MRRERSLDDALIWGRERERSEREGERVWILNERDKF